MPLYWSLLELLLFYDLLSLFLLSGNTVGSARTYYLANHFMSERAKKRRTKET
jgi:hypothetical protein